jgi:hypothetical protein
LVEFLNWEDVQILLDSSAISKDNLAVAIESCGVNFENPESSTLTFEMVIENHPFYCL